MGLHRQFRFLSTRGAALLFGLLTHLFADSHNLSASPLQSAQLREYRLKAGFVFNFMKITTWPEEAMPAGVPIQIGVVEEEDMVDVFIESFSGRRVKDRTILVSRVTTTEEMKAVHLLFVPRQADFDMNLLRTDALGRQPVLVVGESDQFAARGGMIGLVQRKETLRIQVNLASVQQAHLKLGASLASVAEIVVSAP